MAAVGTPCKCGAGKRRRAKKLRSVCTYVPTASVVRKAKTQLHGRFVPKSRRPRPRHQNTVEIADCRVAATSTSENRCVVSVTKGVKLIVVALDVKMHDCRQRQLNSIRRMKSVAEEKISITTDFISKTYVSYTLNPNKISCMSSIFPL